MRRAILIAIASLAMLLLVATIPPGALGQRAQPTGEIEQLADDGYCQHWCCQRICNDKNQCYRHCWCCG